MKTYSTSDKATLQLAFKKSSFTIERWILKNHPLLNSQTAVNALSKWREGTIYLLDGQKWLCVLVNAKFVTLAPVLLNHSENFTFSLRAARTFENTPTEYKKVRVFGSIVDNKFVKK